MKLTSFFFFFFFFFVISVNSFDITKLLDKYPQYTTFNKYLTDYKLADEINSLNTVTVLVVDELNAFGYDGLPEDAFKKILSLQVIPDYYDSEKLQALSKKTTLTTLLQSSGLASGQQGFLNVENTAKGPSFTSAIPGENLSSDFVKTVMTRPSNISILEVSMPIIPISLVMSGQSMPSISWAPAGAPETAPNFPIPEGDASALSPESPFPTELPTHVDGPSASPDAAPSSGVRVVFSACLTLVLGVFYLAAM